MVAAFGGKRQKYFSHLGMEKILLKNLFSKFLKNFTKKNFFFTKSAQWDDGPHGPIPQTFN